jgi:hypothetical protein
VRKQQTRVAERWVKMNAANPENIMKVRARVNIAGQRARYKEYFSGLKPDA